MFDTVAKLAVQTVGVILQLLLCSVHTCS